MSFKNIDKEYVSNTYGRFDLEIVSGSGSLVYDINGKEYIDLSTGIAVNTFGVSDNEWKNAIIEQLNKVQHTSNLYYSEPCAILAKMLCENYDGRVPDTVEELIMLPGVGRKTANLVCGDIYGKPAVVTDTHFIRLCNRFGFVKTTDPLKVEREMRDILPPEKSNGFCHRAVLHGRAVCTARKASCEICCFKDICEKHISCEKKAKGKEKR